MHQWAACRTYLAIGLPNTRQVDFGHEPDLWRHLGIRVAAHKTQRINSVLVNRVARAQNRRVPFRHDCVSAAPRSTHGYHRYLRDHTSTIRCLGPFRPFQALQATGSCAELTLACALRPTLTYSCLLYTSDAADE